jgi:hypothetical protein
VLSLPAVTPRIYSSDEVQYFAYLRSLWFDRDLSFENEYRYFYDRGTTRFGGFHETFLERETDTGRRINFGTVGCAILWSPFYAAGDVYARLTGAPRDGYSKPYLAGIAYGSALYGFLAIVLAILCARRLGLNGFPAALAIWLGTPLLFYMYVAPPFAHASSAFTVALFTWIWLRIRGEWTPAGMAALGAAGALMAMTREQDLFYIAGPALDWVLTRARSWRARAEEDGGRRTGRGWTADVSGVLAAGATFVLVYSPQLVAYKILYGHFGPHGSVANKMKWYSPHALQVLFSPEHGYFVWTPLAVLALVGVVLLFVPPKGGSYTYSVVSAFRRNDVAVPLAVMFLLTVYVAGSVDSWTVAGGFGQRRFVSATTILVIGLASLLVRVRRRALLGALVAVCVYWNLALTAEFAVGLMDRQRLEPARNAYDAFVTLPRLAPRLVYRYLFDRQSFYGANPLSR